MGVLQQRDRREEHPFTPLEVHDIHGDDRVAPNAGAGSPLWPVITLIAVVVAIFALIRDGGSDRAEPIAEEAPATTTEPPATTVAEAVVEVPVPQTQGPLLGLAWLADLVLLDGDEMTFVDLSGEPSRVVDLATPIEPPVILDDQSITVVRDGDLIVMAPGFAAQRILVADVFDNPVALPGEPGAFHNGRGAEPGESIDLITSARTANGEPSGVSIRLTDGEQPFAMWAGRVLVQHGPSIELISLGLERELVDTGDIVAASRDSVLYRQCDAEACRLLVRRSLLGEPVAESVEVPALPVSSSLRSLGPSGTHAVIEVLNPLGPMVSVALVELETGNIRILDEAAQQKRTPLWLPGGVGVLVEGANGALFVDVQFGGMVPLVEAIGSFDGEPIGFAPIRHLAR